ncbi:MAG: glycosyltransferase family 2 protein [Lachnospiraceae bacterium]|nr:glycosyltransferase family 2 protein [Lachnospiraceae bacterium]
MMKTLTVFTPSYNREKLLPRLYRSLCRQNSTDFLWLIVDDGSTDGTGELVEGWRRENRIPIRYIRRQNGGKMRAHNTGVLACETELFVCLDSDDYFSDTAVEDILERWKRVSGSRRIAGIVAHKGRDETHTLYGELFPGERAGDSRKAGLRPCLMSYYPYCRSCYRDCYGKRAEEEGGNVPAESSLSALYRMGFRGETTLVFRTEILKRYLFPEIPGEKYVPEDYVYDQIDRKYRLSVLPKILTICELVESGYSDRVDELRRQNPTGWYLYYVNRSRYESRLSLKLKYMSHCLRFRRIAYAPAVRRHPLPKALAIAGLPGATVLLLMGKL